MSRESLIAEMEAALDRLKRPASVAQIGGFRPPSSPLTSWFGAHFVGREGETWPTCDGLPMLPLLQVRVDELPVRPPPLQDVALFNVFIGPERLPVDLPAKNGDRWSIRTYAQLDGLQLLSGQPQSHIRPFPVGWSLRQGEGPTWEESALGHDLQARIAELDDGFRLFGERSKRHHSTKVGGWPGYIQSPIGVSDAFVFQIGSEEKPRWMWGDNGNGYFYFHDGQWLMYWDCY
jgi:hypothetical protein